MRLAQTAFRVLVALSAVPGLTCALSGTAHADRLPLLGSNPTSYTGSASIKLGVGLVVPVDPDSVSCFLTATFTDVAGGATPGTNYDGIVMSGGVFFGESFAGQTVGSSGNFDVVSGAPSNPLTLHVGAPGQNLDVFDYSTNVLTGLGPLVFPDLDAIGEGSIAILYPFSQFRVGFEIVGGNGGSATLGFYRADGSLLDSIGLSGLGDLRYRFATADGTSSIAGILIQNTDPAGIGVDNVCYDQQPTTARAVTWGSVKSRYR